jgi:hypothetical protein
MVEGQSGELRTPGSAEDAAPARRGGAAGRRTVGGAGFGGGGETDDEATGALRTSAGASGGMGEACSTAGSAVPERRSREPAVAGWPTSPVDRVLPRTSNIATIAMESAEPTATGTRIFARSGGRTAIKSDAVT